jgi:hypothetical protein
MTAVILGWDPDRGNQWVPPYEHALAQVSAEGSARTTYRVAGEVPAVGTTVHLMLQGRTRGLIGNGVVRSRPFPSSDPAHPGTMAWYVLVEWEHLLPATDRIGPEELDARVPDVPWRSLYGSCTPLDAEQSHRLERVWRAPHPSARPGRSRLARVADHVQGRGGPVTALPGLAARLLHR